MGYEDLLERFLISEFTFWKYSFATNEYSILTNPHVSSYFQLPAQGDLALLAHTLGEERLMMIIKAVEESLLKEKNTFKANFSMGMNTEIKHFAIFGKIDESQSDRSISIEGVLINLPFSEEEVPFNGEKDVLKEILNEKNHFLSELSHELRTPLNGISGMTQLLKLTEMTEEQREYLRIMQAASRKMGRLIDNLIRYTIFLGKNVANTSKDKIKMREFFRQTIESQKIELLDHHLSIEMELSSELETEIMVDADSLSEIIDQLLDNAIKFSSEGQIFLRAYIEYLEPGSETLFVEIEDEGVGFDVSDTYATEKERNNKHKAGDLRKSSGGLGLGLQIVEHVCKQSGIDIEMESVLGTGTKVKLKVPFEKTMEHPINHDFIGRQMNGKKALVVDDDENGRVLLTLLCKKSGLVVESASNGFDAIKLAKKHRYDLIYLDIQMPQMNGVEVFSNIREEGLNKDVPIIAVTAYALKGDEERFLSNGFDGYIGKPVEFNRFEQVTRHVLQLKY